jgi:hypothetical protein
MSKDNVISLKNPERNADVLTDLLRSGARSLSDLESDEIKSIC